MPYRTALPAATPPPRPGTPAENQLRSWRGTAFRGHRAQSPSQLRIGTARLPGPSLRSSLPLSSVVSVQTLRREEHNIRTVRIFRRLEQIFSGRFCRFSLLSKKRDNNVKLLVNIASDARMARKPAWKSTKSAVLVFC